MQEMFLGLPLAADEEHVTCLSIFTDGSASLDAAWPRRRTAAGWGAVVLQGKPGAEQGLIGVVGGQVMLHRDHLHFSGATTLHGEHCRNYRHCYPCSVFGGYVLCARDCISGG